MLVVRPSLGSISDPQDLFRDTTQRWRTSTGGQPIAVCDYAFGIDGSLTWRVVAGLAQGEVGRTREFHVQQVGADLELLSFAARPGTRITAALDFRRGTVTGYVGAADASVPFVGTFETL